MFWLSGANENVRPLQDKMNVPKHVVKGPGLGEVNREAAERWAVRYRGPLGVDRYRLVLDYCEALFLRRARPPSTPRPASMRA